jgi:hypothetical protein
MKRSFIRLALVAALAVPLFAHAESVREEAKEHPRIATAIREIEEAIRYMEAAPHDFGGHKAEALEASRKAVAELRKALAYRAHADSKR